MARKSKDSGTVTAIIAVIVIGLIISAIDFIKENLEAFAVIGVIIAGIIAMRIAKRQRARLKAEYARQEALERKANAVKKPPVSMPTYTPSYTSEPESVKEEPEQSNEIKMPTILVSFSSSYSSSSRSSSARETKGDSLLQSFDNYVAIDLETTGLNPSDEEIIEFAAVRVVNGRVADTFSSLANPRREISEEITKITGITNEMLKDVPDVADVLKDFLAFVGDSVVVGHNVNFDINFIYDSCERHGLGTFSNNFVDTMRISRKCTVGARNHKLDTLLKHYGIVNDNAHRALSDALCTQQLYEIIKTCIFVDKVWPETRIFGKYTNEAIYNTFVDMIKPADNTTELKVLTKNTFIRFFGQNAFTIRLNSRSAFFSTENEVAREFVSKIPESYIQKETQFIFPLTAEKEYKPVISDLVNAVYNAMKPQ